MASRAVAPFVRRPALERFAEKCRFDATTGCVLWIGGKSSGQGNSATYGVFKDGGRRWFAHRWAAHHIHGLEIDGLQVDHCCVDYGAPANNTLCVQHLQAVTLLQNLELRWGRRLWGWDEWRDPEPIEPDPDAIPFHLPPPWFRPFMLAEPLQECPF
jgi:hypothetical protein